MRLILLGAPGAGTGTQAEILSRELGIPTISTGNILRAAIREGTAVGLKAKALIDAGKLVDDETIMGIVSERLAKDDCAQGYILDGVPRTIPQAEAMETMGIAIDAALSIEIADETIVERMSGRRKRMEKVLKLFPKTTFIGAHFGGWSVWDEATRLLHAYDNLFVDSSSTFHWVEPSKVKTYIRTYGSEKVMFGSDFPMWNVKPELDAMLSLDLSDSEYENIFHITAQRLFKIKDR